MRQASFAIVRAPSDTLGDCQLTHLGRQRIDVEKARREHADYGRLLAAAGYTLIHLEPDPRFPDGVFVEDTAVVLPELAVICRPGARSRRAETRDVAAALERLRPIEHVESPAIIDGGDVLQVGRRLFVGRSSRTNDAGVEALRRSISAHGYSVVAVPVGRALHLKTAVTALDEETVIANPGWVDTRLFADLAVLEVDPAEPAAGNVLSLESTVVMNAACPRTIAAVRGRGYGVVAHDLSELAKAEAGLTCSSLLVAGEAGRSPPA